MTEQEKFDKMHAKYYNLYIIAGRLEGKAFDVYAYDYDEEAENDLSVTGIKALCKTIVGEINALMAGVE